MKNKKLLVFNAVKGKTKKTKIRPSMKYKYEFKRELNPVHKTYAKKL